MSHSAPRPDDGRTARNRQALALLAAFLAAGAISAIRPASWFNWFSETFPAWIGAAIVVIAWRRFPFTPLACVLMLLFSTILFTGGHYTYAAVPLGEWMKSWFGFERNHFDRVGHFFQGVIPAMLYRELLLRRSPLRPGPRVFFVSCAMALAISALYEIFEWRYAVTFGGDAANDFLGSQGDPWDAQEDMSMALLGSIASQLLLARWHDRQIARLAPRAAQAPAIEGN